MNTLLGGNIITCFLSVDGEDRSGKAISESAPMIKMDSVIIDAVTTRPFLFDKPLLVDEGGISDHATVSKIGRWGLDVDSYVDILDSIY